MKMITKIVSLAVICSAVGLFAEAPTFGADIGIESKYMYNGIDLNSGPVMQSDAWVAWGDFSVSVWSSVDVTDELDQQGDIDELDISADYYHEFDNLVYEMGLIYVMYPNLNSGAEAETYVGLYSNMDVFNFGVAAGYGLDVNWFYMAPEISVGFGIGDYLYPSLSAKLGMGGENYYDCNYEVVTDFGLNDFGTSLALEIYLPGAIGDYLYATGHVSYSLLLNEDAIDAVEADDWGGDKGNFWAGFTLSTEF